MSSEDRPPASLAVTVEEISGSSDNIQVIQAPASDSALRQPPAGEEPPKVEVVLADTPNPEAAGRTPSKDAKVRFGGDEAAADGEVRVSTLQMPMTPTATSNTRRASQQGASGWTKMGPSPSHQNEVKHKTLKDRYKESRFYHGETANKLRNIVNGKVFLAVMTVALFIALFLPEIWVLAGVDSNIEVDIILTMVMAMFVIEFLLLTLLDATYFLSFFFLMDILGTISMVFDISFMVGTDNTSVQTYAAQSDDSSTKNNLMLLRAARAARVGARAGRLSRVLRILRFLPFLNAGKKQDESAGIAGSISRQLANLLATRVACLTIILVIVIPAFDILSFPQNDHSLQAWVERLGENLAEDTTMGMQAFEIEMKAMVGFFRKKSYGPYIACAGSAGTDEFRCSQQYSTSWTFSAPSRSASALWVHTPDFMVGFNMHDTLALDKGLAMLKICFIIGIMIFSGLALTNIVTELAVRPLERMLATVRSIADQVFKMSSGLVPKEEDQAEEEEFDINTSTEMKLLEKVVTKLSVIADLQSGKNAPDVNEDMNEEDVGILNMMQGKDVVSDGKKQAARRVSRLNKHKVQLKGQKGLEDCGVTAAVFNSFHFNTLTLNNRQMVNIGIYVLDHYFDDGDGFIHSAEEKAALQKFVAAAEKEYPPNLFHNFSHATDVLHGVARMMRMVGSENWLTELEQFALLVSAIGHDIGHPGVNNGFLSEVGHELAIQYNDLSPLENMHVSKLYTILQSKDTNVFVMLSKEQFKEVRKYCIETILHTDMMGHQAMVKDLQMLFQMNSEIFTNCSMGVEAQMEVFSTPEHKILLMDNFLHSADVSNPCRVWDVSHAWAQCVLEEFFAQGDQEKMLGVPVQFLNDRDKLNRPNSQIGFLEFMIAPFFGAQIKIFHALHEYGDLLSSNIASWEEMWVKEVQPEEEAKAKVAGRVAKVQASLQEAKASGDPHGGTNDPRSPTRNSAASQ